MNIKGTSLTSTMKFVRENFPERFDEWLNELPVRSRELFINPILATTWYPIQEGMIIPTQIAAKLFYNGDEAKTSFKIGEFSAKEGLNGVYKIFVKIASPVYVLGRSQRIFKTYYQTIEVDFDKEDDKKVVFTIKGFKNDEKLIFPRMCGWIEETLRIIGQDPMEVTHSEIPLGGDYVDAKIIAEWK